MEIGVNAFDVIAKSDALIPELVAPPIADSRVCIACRTWLPTGRDSELSPSIGALDECENCLEVREALGVDPLHFAVISLYKKPSQLRDWLTRYKGRADEEDVFEPNYVEVVRAIMGRFIVEHGLRLREMAGGFDGVIVVPSTHRPPPHPLEDVLDSLNIDLPQMRLLERGPGALGFRNPHPQGYQVTRSLAPCRLLLVDDVYTTGARFNSAARALTSAGHQVKAGLVLARRINPGYTEEAANLWTTATSTTFDWRTSPWIPT